MNKKAFTLIELLVVVLIIGILAAIALPQYQLAVAKARIMSQLPVIRSIDSAQQVYKLANGEYALDLEDLDVQIPASNNNASYINWINPTGKAASFVIQDKKTSLMLEKFYDRDYFICWASMLNANYELQNKICQAITGLPRQEAGENATQVGYRFQ